MSNDPNHNQPILKNSFVVFHNGIILEEGEGFASKGYSLDSEYIIDAAIESNNNFSKLEEMLLKLQGENTCLIVNQSGKILCFTNVGNLYKHHDAKGNIWFASEEIFLKEVFDCKPEKILKNSLQQVGQVLVTTNWQERNFVFGKSISLESDQDFELTASANLAYKALVSHTDFKRPLVRCSRCILPSEFPGVDLNSDGICGFCRNYVPQICLGTDKLFSELSRLQSDKKVQVNFSGGRDSTYALLFLHENGFKVTACTYDWGFITTAARENMSRICGKLGIEHILVSPNLRRTRSLAATALNAWLKIGDPSLIPALMAGDKPQLSSSMLVSKELGHLPIIQGDHALESTHFKSALAGAKTSSKKHSGGVSYRLPLMSVFFMGLGYLRLIWNADKFRFALLKQLARSAWIYYVQSHNLVHIFKYLPWEEKAVDLKVRAYGWTSNLRNPNQKWRMGDATAPLYNCLYLLTIGYTENDALRSNQVRAGLLTRSSALTLVERENTIDINGIHSYLGLIEMDPNYFWNKLHELIDEKKRLRGV
jgi:hypothetical protein